MGGFEGESWADIEAPITEVFAVVADLEALPEWQPDVKVARCLERDRHGRARLMHTELQTVIRRTSAILRVEYAEPTSVRWTMEDGDVSSFEGGWRLTALPSGATRAHYAVTIDFGRKLGLLVRGPASGALAGAAVSSMPGKLKQRVEGQGRAAMVVHDAVA